MGDIFRRETAERPEPFTGERLTSAIGGQVQIEHYHRYLFARSLVGGAEVLDVASGEGYGSALLAQVARSVIGVEHSGSAVRAAADNFPRQNLQFIQGDARTLPVANGCVDAVVSFETIEHFDRHDDFLREVRRVLRSEGSFIVSTPDRDIYSPAGTPANPFHVRELSPVEFASLLRGSFRHVLVMRQRAMIGSTLLADTGSPAPPLVFDRRGDAHFEACIGVPRAPYLIAVASDSDLPPVPPCLYIDRSDLDTDARQCMALADRLRQVEAELTQVRGRAGQAAQQAEQAEARAMEAAAQAMQAEARAVQAEAQAMQADDRAVQAESRNVQAEARGASAEMQVTTLQRDYELLQGSLRAFLRGYLPRLRHHLFGQRP